MIDMITNIFLGVYSFMNGSFIPLLVAVVGIIYFGWAYYRATKTTKQYRKEVRQNIITQALNSLQKKEYSVASAGSRETGACAKVETIDIQLCNLNDSFGRPLDQSKYKCFVVHGDSMRYAGIKDNDFILTPRVFNVDFLRSFPEILVIRYREQSDDKPQFKVRRAWYRGSIEDNLEEVAQNIMAMPKFGKLTQQEGYKGSDWMIKDLLEKRLVDYKKSYHQEGACSEEYQRIVISTTFDSVRKEIHFSIHPESLIVGNVTESYTI